MARLGGGVGVGRLAGRAARHGAGQRDGAGGAAGAGRRGAGAVPRVHDGQGQGGRARAVARRRPRPGRRGARGDGARRAGARRRQRRVVGRRRARGPAAGSPPTTSSTPSSRARRSRSCATCGWRWRATASTCPSPRTSPSARPRTRCGCATSRRPTSSWSRWRRSVGCAPRSRSSRPAGCPRWCRRPSTPASASRPGSRSPRPCRRSSTPAGWAPSRCSPATSRSTPLVPVAGALAVGRVAVDPERLEQLRSDTRARRLVARPGGRRAPSTSQRGDPMIDVRWAWLFLDTPRADADRSWALLVRGHRVVAVRDRAASTTSSRRSCPPRGDPWLKLQAVAEGPGGIHLDLDVDDVQAAAAEAERLGASRIGGIGDRGRDPALARRPGLLPHAVARRLRPGAGGLGRAGRPGLPRLPGRRPRGGGRVLDGAHRVAVGRRRRARAVRAEATGRHPVPPAVPAAG